MRDASDSDARDLSAAAAHDSWPWGIAAAWVVSGFSLFVFLVRVVAVAGNDAQLLHPTGVIAALADDVRHGLLYRPLYDEQLGYGGTRYFPLAFVAQGLFMGSLGARGSVYAFSALSALVFVSGFFVLSRRLGVPRWLTVLGAA